jgi:hypothetical protein
VGLERDPLSLVSTTEELLDRKVAGSCLENREYGRRDQSRWPRGIRKKLAITSPTSGGLSVGIVRLQTQAMELKKSHVALDVWNVGKILCPFRHFFFNFGKSRNSQGAESGEDGECSIF